MTGLTGCAAAAVPYTSDPAKKLKNAESLYINSNRPLPAESLIEEAYEGCRKKYAKDDTCLAAVYITYAGFLQSNAVSNWAEGYRKDGFWDKSVTVDNRFEKAIEYWFKAIEIFEKERMFAEASNGYLNIGKIYHYRIRNASEACKKYNQSIQSHLKFKNEYPGEEVQLPKGYNNFIDFIDYYKKSAGCEE